MMKKLPRGEFVFSFNDQQFKGKFCTWTLARFSEKMNIPTVTDLYKLLTMGISIRALAELLICSIEYYERESSYSADNAYEWIDEIGGIVNVIELLRDSVAIETKEDAKKKPK